MIPKDFHVTPCSVRGFSILSWNYPLAKKGESFTIPRRGLQMETELAVLFAGAPHLLTTAQCNVKTLKVTQEAVLEAIDVCASKEESELLGAILDLVKDLVSTNEITVSLAEIGEYDG